MRLRAAFRYLKSTAKNGPLYPLRKSVFPRRILSARPILTETSGDLKVCVLTSKKDWLPCLWSLFSFYEFSGRRDPLIVFSDGTLSAAHAAGIRTVFPNARIIDKWWADAVMPTVLDAYPRCRHYRTTQPYARKIIDFPALCHSGFILVLDSDILFFREPRELNLHLAARHGGRYVFMRDFQDAYSAPRERIQAEFGLELPEAVNSGVVVADVSNFRYDWIEKWLCHSELFEHLWSEQTLWAMYGTRNDTEMLSSDYVARLGFCDPSKIAMRHYVSLVRDLMYMEGIPHLASLLEERGVFQPADNPCSPSAVLENS